jgi:glucosamine--fructose-6-phosphate aminotransferase (isomerizing)
MYLHLQTRPDQYWTAKPAPALPSHAARKICHITGSDVCVANNVKAAALAENILSSDLDETLVERLAAARMVFIAGRNNGVAEELALKATEIMRKPSMYLDGTRVLHGYEEIMTSDDVVIFVEPYETEFAKMDEIFVKNVGAEVLCISSGDTPFSTVKVPLLEGYSNYLALLAGWNILVATGLKLGVNLDKPVRARKVGNAI